MNNLPDIKIFNHDVFEDFRGELYTLWDSSKFIPNLEFNHDKISTSRKNVLRGLHGDYKSWKLISCLYGELYFVVADNNPLSPTYQQYMSMILSSRNRQSVLIPPGFANGFLVLSEESIFHYKWVYPGEYPDVNEQFSINWKSPELSIHWPINNPILSERDSYGK